eukprot:7386348-Prymnesium_polylepis.1
MFIDEEAGEVVEPGSVGFRFPPDGSCSSSTARFGYSECNGCGGLRVALHVLCTAARPCLGARREKQRERLHDGYLQWVDTNGPRPRCPRFLASVRPGPRPLPWLGVLAGCRPMHGSDSGSGLD